MSKNKRGKRRPKSGRPEPEAASPATTQTLIATNVTHILYSALALFWIYAGITSATAASQVQDSQGEISWMVPASVAFFAVGWFLYYLINLIAAQGRTRLAQILFLVFFLIFLAGMVPVFLADSELVRIAGQTYISFGLAGLLLRMATLPRARGGIFGALRSQRRRD